MEDKLKAWRSFLRGRAAALREEGARVSALAGTEAYGRFMMAVHAAWRQALDEWRGPVAEGSWHPDPHTPYRRAIRLLRIKERTVKRIIRKQRKCDACYSMKHAQKNCADCIARCATLPMCGHHVKHGAAARVGPSMGGAHRGKETASLCTACYGKAKRRVWREVGY